MSDIENTQTEAEDADVIAAAQADAGDPSADLDALSYTADEDVISVFEYQDDPNPFVEAGDALAAALQTGLSSDADKALAGWDAAKAAV